MKGLSKEKIEELKKKHGDIFAVTFEDGEVTYLKKPDRKILSLAMSKMQSSPLAFAETLLNQCFIGGFEGWKEDDDYFFGASEQLDKLMQKKTAELEKL